MQEMPFFLIAYHCSFLCSQICGALLQIFELLHVDLIKLAFQDLLLLYPQFVYSSSKPTPLPQAQRKTYRRGEKTKS